MSDTRTTEALGEKLPPDQRGLSFSWESVPIRVPVCSVEGLDLANTVSFFLNTHKHTTFSER